LRTGRCRVAEESADAPFAAAASFGEIVVDVGIVLDRENARGEVDSAAAGVLPIVAILPINDAWRTVGAV
jgi:hypothetical protein